MEIAAIHAVAQLYIELKRVGVKPYGNADLAIHDRKNNCEI